MRKLVSLVLALGMLAAVSPAAMAEEFFAEQEDTESSSEDFFSEDFFAEGETIDVDENIPEAATEETGDTLEERSIVSVADDAVDTGAWTQAPTVYVKPNTTKGVDGQVYVYFVQEGISALADLEIPSGWTLKYYVYEINDSGIANQVACVALPTKTVKKKTVLSVFTFKDADEIEHKGAGAKVLLKNQAEGDHTYMVRAELQKLNKTTKAYAEKYGNSSDITLDSAKVNVAQYSTAWKNVRNMTVAQVQDGGSYVSKIQLDFDTVNLPNQIAFTGFKYPINFYKASDGSYYVKETVGKKTYTVADALTVTPDGDGAHFTFVFDANASAQTVKVTVQPIIKSGKKTVKGNTTSKSLGMFVGADKAWKAQPTILSAAQTGSGIVTLKFKQDIKMTEDETYWSKTRFKVTGFKETIYLSFTEDGALKPLATYSKANPKVSTYENDGEKYYVVEGKTSKYSGAVSFVVTPVQAKYKNTKTKKWVEPTGTASGKKSVTMKASSASAAMNVKLGYVSSSGEAAVSFVCNRTGASSFKVTVTGSYKAAETASVTFEALDGTQTVDGYTITKSGTTYKIESFAATAGDEYSVLVETYLANGERIVDKATCIASESQAVDAANAPEVQIKGFSINVGGESIADGDTTLTDSTLYFDCIAIGGDEDYTYSIIKDEGKTGEETIVETTSSSALNCTIDEGEHTYTYKVSCVNIGKEDYVKYTITGSDTFTKGDFTYTRDTDGNLTVVSYAGTDTTVTVLKTVDYAGNKNMPVTAIGYTENGGTKVGAFEGNTAVSKVVLPNAIEEIGENAFSGCTSLASMSCY